MIDLLKLILGVLASLFRSRAKLEAENLVLRQQINVLRRRMPKRPDLNNTDRFLFVWLYRWYPSVLEAVAIVRPETIIPGTALDFERIGAGAQERSSMAARVVALGLAQYDGTVAFHRRPLSGFHHHYYRI
jgi:hypothetical protein